jgi:hypothetical protein
VHHSGKDTSAGARGSSALRGGTDTELELKGDGDNLTLEARKQRNGREGRIGRYRLVPVADSVALVEARALAPGTERALNDNDRAALEALERIAVAEGVTATTWQECCDLPRSSFSAARKRLLDAGVVVQPRVSRYLPSPSPSAGPA